MSDSMDEALEYCTRHWPHLVWTASRGYRNYLIIGADERCTIRLAVGNAGAIARLIIEGSRRFRSSDLHPLGWEEAIAELEEDAKAIAASITPKEEVDHE